MSDNNKNMSIGAKLGIASFGLLICVIGVLTYYIIYFNSKKYKKSVLDNYNYGSLYQIPETAKRFFDGPEGGPPYIQFINPKNKTDGVVLNIQNNGTAANLVTWQQSGIYESQVQNIGNSFTFDGDKINGITAPNFIGNVTGKTGSFSGSVTSPSFSSGSSATSASFVGNVTGNVTGDVTGKTGSFTTSVTAPTFNGNVTGTTGSFSSSVTAPTFSGHATSATTANSIYTGYNNWVTPPLGGFCTVYTDGKGKVVPTYYWSKRNICADQATRNNYSTEDWGVPLPFKAFNP